MPGQSGVRMLLAGLLVLVFLPIQSLADRVTVRALDQSTGSGIGEARLSLAGAGRMEVSDTTGWIQVDGLEPGIYEGLLSGPGYSSRRLRIEIIRNGPAYRKEIFLTPIVHELAAFEVTTTLNDEDRDTIAKRDSIAPMDQISGDELKDVTDEHLGDTLEKIAGVNVDTESGNVSGINIRGAGPKQTRVTLDGNSMAGGGGRGTTRGAGAMGQIPREFLNRVQVMKAPTPDMDADAIGGTVDLQTSRVAKTKKPRTTMTARSGYQQAGDTFNSRLSVAHAQPIPLGKSDRRAGILIALNVQKGEMMPDEMRILNHWPEKTSPDTGEKVQALGRLRAGKREISNEGYGLVINTDLQLNKQNHFQLKAMWNSRDSTQSSEFHTLEFIQGSIASLTPEYGQFKNMRMEKQFYETMRNSKSGSLVFAGEHKFGNWTLEESIGFSFAESGGNDTQNAVFRTLKEFDGSYDMSESHALPRVSISKDGTILTPDDLTDPEPYRFVRYDLIDDYADDEETALRANLARKWDGETAEWIFKSGIKARLRDASKDQDKVKYTSNPTFQLSEVSGLNETAIFRDHYPLGPSWSADAMADRFLSHEDDFSFNPLDVLMDSAAGDFSVSESICAAYGMIQRETEKWIFIGGLRLERTESETHGFETLSYKDNNGERVVEVEPVSISDSYNKWFPGLHALYRPNPNWIFRASLTRTLQRPDFRDLSPSKRVNLDYKRIRAGNPDLEPFDAKAVDIGTDFIINQWGSVSLGLFYKRIDDFIVDIEEKITEEDDEKEYIGFIRSRPVNGAPADLLGFEAAWSSQLAFLPGPFSNTSLSANYTLTDSSAAYPGHPGEIIMLPKQVRENLNISLRWRSGNWTINLRSKYRGLQLRDLTEPGQDQFNDGYWSYSASIAYKLNDTFSFSMGMANLNRPDRLSYQGVPTRPTAAREGSRSFSIGLNMKFGGTQWQKPGTGTPSKKG
jgi:TonB-dependent receptor